MKGFKVQDLLNDALNRTVRYSSLSSNCSRTFARTRLSFLAAYHLLNDLNVTLCLHRAVDNHCLELGLLCQLCQFFLSDHLTYFSSTSLTEIGASFEKHSSLFPPEDIVSNICLLLTAPCLLQNNAIYDVIELFTFSHRIFNQDPYFYFVFIQTIKKVT